MTTDERCEPTRIGAGSFATVFVIRGGPEAFKEVARATAEDTATLRQEFDFLEDIYRKCNGDSFFAIPRGLAFNDPFAVSDGFLAHDAPSPASVARRRGVRPVVTAGVMAAFSRPAYAMDRVYALPYDAGKVIARLFFPPTIKDSPALCRLYFGKDFSNAKASRFINTQNFPLDASRYMQLRAAFPEELPDASVIAKGMGEMLARLHYRSAVDARDVEFVLGGAGKARFSYFIIDFNQVCCSLHCMPHLTASRFVRARKVLKVLPKPWSMPSSTTIHTTLALAPLILSTPTSNKAMSMRARVKIVPSPTHSLTGLSLNRSRGT